MRLPSFADYRGGGLRVRFVSNPRKPGGTHGVAAHVAALTALYGNLSDNSGHHWNQFFDNHLGFYVPRMGELPRRLLDDGVPFFTGLVRAVACCRVLSRAVACCSVCAIQAKCSCFFFFLWWYRL